ncbi:MAG: hypothetical protein J5I62_02390 [Flavobacteriales bacterium]|nr:hypothetical protein [Flavobacteriales bacterium]MEB2340995.1 hypothetical protein [Flavobacteriia bacterium]
MALLQLSNLNLLCGMQPRQPDQHFFRQMAGHLVDDLSQKTIVLQAPLPAAAGPMSLPGDGGQWHTCVNPFQGAYNIDFPLGLLSEQGLVPAFGVHRAK